jgi:tetratricopeptide (TPR) repeat protein
MEEMTKAVLESGVLKELDERYDLTGAMGSLTIPATLQDSLMSRLDRLVTAKAVAQYAAVIGRQFSYELLQAVSELDEATLQRELGRLVDAELVYQRGLPPYATYTFKHALIQDTAYQSLLRNTRQQYHQRIAQTLEERFPETAETQPELVAHHYTEAGADEPAIAFWQRAGEQANQRSAYREATAHLTQALHLLEGLPENTARIHREIRLLLTLGRPLLSAKGNAASEVGQLYIQVRKLCEQVDDPSSHFAALHGLRVFYNGRAEHHQASEAGEEALRIAQRLDDSELLAEGYLDVGVPQFYRGEFSSAIENFRQSVKYANAHQESPGSYSLGGLGAGLMSQAHGSVALWMAGYPEQALQWCEEALGHSQRLNNPRLLGMAQAWAVVLYGACHAWSMLHETATRQVELCTEYGLSQGLFGTIMLGWWRVFRAQDADGINQLREGIQAYQGIEMILNRPLWLGQLAEAYTCLGQLEEGWNALEEAFAVMHRTAEYRHHVELHRLKGAWFLACSEEQSAEAETCFHEALKVARSQQAKSLELRAAMSLGRLWRSQGKCQDACDLLAPVYDWFTEGFDTADLIEAKDLLDELSEEVGTATA